MKNDEPAITRLSEVRPKHVQWLWRGFIPQGKLTLIEGDPGLGKSTVTMDVAARVTTGQPFPDGSSCAPANVLILSAEDDPADTILPRLEAAGGDPSRALVMTQSDGHGSLSLTDHLRHVDDVIRRYSVKLVVVDPLTAHLGRIDGYKDQDIRSVLAPLASLGQRYGTTILPIRHLTKNTGAAAVHRGGGSIAIGAAARLVLLVSAHPDDRSRRLLSVVKSNLAERPIPMEFVLEQVGGVSRVEWLGSTDLGEKVIGSGQVEIDEYVDLEEILLDIVSEEGPIRPPLVMQRLRAAGHTPSDRSLSRARKRLGIRYKRYGFGVDGYYLWFLPGQELPEK